MDDVEASVVALAAGDDTHTAHIATARGHGDDAGVKLDEVGNLASGEINLDGIVDLDRWVWVADTRRIGSAFL